MTDWMRNIRQQYSAWRWLAYPATILVVALTTLVLFLFRDQLNTSIVALLFLLPVLVSTTLWGLGPGILSGILTFLCYNFFFLTPYYTLQVHDSQDIIALGIFFLVAILINQLVGRAKRGLEAALAREYESTALYELSIGLAGVYSLQDIAGIIASRTLETFRAVRVEIQVEKIFGEKGFTTTAGEGDSQQANLTNTIAALETARGRIGEIRVCCSGAALTSSELRLLHTFAAQGALALERAALAHADTRAQVLEESDRLKSALLLSVSHEFRTPLVTIKAATTSLLSQQVDWNSEARGDLLSAVDEEADHLNALIGNLLNMSKIEAGALKPNRQWNVLSEIVDDVVRRMHRALANHMLEVDIPEELPLVPVDYSQIDQVFTNLIGNSTKYAPAGSKIHLRARVLDKCHILIKITNAGPPVEPEHLDRIFDKFYRVTNAESVSGTGLGLSISKGIIEAHDGRIWAENLPEGFTFHFTLPLSWDGIAPPMIQGEVE